MLHILIYQTNNTKQQIHKLKGEVLILMVIIYLYYNIKQFGDPYIPQLQAHVNTGLIHIDSHYNFRHKSFTSLYTASMIVNG